MKNIAARSLLNLMLSFPRNFPRTLSLNCFPALRFDHLMWILMSSLLAAFFNVASAQSPAWPVKPIKLVAVFPPGGSVDQVARVISQPLQVLLGQPVFVDNKGGALGSIGTAAVAKSEPDGYTFAVVFDTHGVNPSLIPNLSYDTKKDLLPVMLI